MRKVTIYRDDSTTQVVYHRVKHFFWTAGNSVLTIAQYDVLPAHHYIHWNRERFVWFKDEPDHEERNTQNIFEGGHEGWEKQHD